MVQVSSIKVSVPINGTLLPRDILPAEGAPGSAKALVTLKVKSGDIELSASLKAKSYREVLSKVDASSTGAIAVLQGKLGPDGTILEAGFTVAPIIPKAEKLVASA